MYGSIVHVNQGGAELNRIRPGGFTLDRLARASFIPQPTVFLRRSLYERIGALAEWTHFSMDYEYWVRAARVTTPGWLNRFTATLRYHAVSKSSSTLGRFLEEELEFFDRLIDAQYAQRFSPGVLRFAELSRSLYVAGELSGCPEDARSLALQRARAIAPPPTVRELTDIIAGHDGFLSSPYVNPESDEAAHASRANNGDACRILSALRSGGIISAGTEARVARRARACALLAATVKPSAKHRFRMLAEAGATLARHPDLATQRGLWVRLARAVPFFRAVRIVHDRTANLATAWRTRRSKRHRRAKL
jgi:hypothetical protein